MSKDKGRVVKAVNFQIGSSNIKIDKEIDALLPGKRISRDGNIYYEYRKNRSDLRNRI